MISYIYLEAVHKVDNIDSHSSIHLWTTNDDLQPQREWHAGEVNQQAKHGLDGVKLFNASEYDV